MCVFCPWTNYVKTTSCICIHNYVSVIKSHLHFLIEGRRKRLGSVQALHRYYSPNYYNRKVKHGQANYIRVIKQNARCQCILDGHFSMWILRDVGALYLYSSKKLKPSCIYHGLDYIATWDSVTLTRIQVINFPTNDNSFTRYCVHEYELLTCYLDSVLLINQFYDYMF